MERQDVRMPDILDIGRRYQAIGNRYRKIFAGARQTNGSNRSNSFKSSTCSGDDWNFCNNWNTLNAFNLEPMVSAA